MREARYGGAESDENVSVTTADGNRFADSELVEDRPHASGQWWRGGIVYATQHVIRHVKQLIREQKPGVIGRKFFWSILDEWFDLCLSTERKQTVLFCCPYGHKDETACVSCPQNRGCEHQLIEFPHAYAHHADYFRHHVVQRVMRTVSMGGM